MWTHSAVSAPIAVFRRRRSSGSLGLRPDDAAWRSIRLLLLDVDGVLTPRRFELAGASSDAKTFSLRDGRAIKDWLRCGRWAAVLSSRTSEATARRAAELGIETVIQGAEGKLSHYEQLRSRFGVEDAAVCYVGDDHVDLDVMRRVGLPVAVGDAAARVRLAAAYITDAVGGDGAVCEVIERLMRRQGLAPAGA